jgi:cytochrome c oxidase assembly protein subunit 15
MIVVTGAAVRLTGSGLGCSDWPNCEEDRFVGELSYHTAIEQGNRWLTGIVSIAVIVAVLGAYRRIPRRPDLIRWSWGLVLGVLGQIVLGGIVVLSELNPWLVLGHFILSMVLVWNATVVHRRASWTETELGHVARRTSLVVHSWTIKAFAMAAIFVGTLVTGSGPHTGSRDEPIDRLPFDVPSIARIHGIVVVGLLAAVLTFFLRARREQRIDLAKQTTVVIAVLIAQAAIGYIQYFTGVPIVLVAFHIAGATALWIAVVYLSMSVTMAEADTLDACFEDMVSESA